MTDLTLVERYIEFQEEQTARGKPATLEEFRHRLGEERRRDALGAIAEATAPNAVFLDGDKTPDEIVAIAHRIAKEALKEEA
jgi:hypothetical protein